MHQNILFLTNVDQLEELILFIECEGRNQDDSYHYTIGLNNFDEFTHPYQITKPNYRISVIGLNGHPHDLENFRNFFAENLYETIRQNIDPFAEENESLLWLFNILYLENFAIFQQRVYIAKKISKLEFDHIYNYKNSAPELFDHEFWITPLESSLSIRTKSVIIEKKEKLLKNIIRIYKNRCQRLISFILDVNLRKILNFIMPKSIIEKVRVSKIYIRKTFRKFIRIFLYLISKFSIHVASKSDYVIIVDAGHLKLDPSKDNRSFYMDYFPDLEKIYRNLGKVTVLNFRPRPKLKELFQAINSGFWPVWPNSSKVESKKAMRLEMEFGLLALDLYERFGYVMPKNLKGDIHHYWPEIDFVRNNFNKLTGAQIILLGWDGRNRGISVGLNEIGLNFSSYQSALGSYDLSHSGVPVLGLRSKVRSNGVPSPHRYYLWRSQDEMIIRRMGFLETQIKIVGSLRISSKRSEDEIEPSEFYSRHFSKQFQRCIIWAPVLNVIGSPTLFNSRHDEIFSILQSKLMPTDCILIKPWPGADSSEFEKFASFYENTAIWNPKETWTNAGLLKLSFGVIGTFSSFLLEANNMGSRILILNFPESKNYFDFETYREFLNMFQSISSIQEMKTFTFEGWSKTQLNDFENAVFCEDCIIGEERIVK